MMYFKDRVLLGVVAAFVSSQSFAYDFNCKGAKSLVDILSLGPEGVVDKIDENIRGYAYKQIPGWECYVLPLSLTKNNQLYIEALQCSRSDKKTSPTEHDFASAGESYQNNISKFLECFPNGINSTSVSYGKGEGYLLDTGQYLQGADKKKYHILAEYNYLQGDAGEIIWNIAAIVGSPKKREAVSNSDNFCSQLKQVVANSNNGFKAYKGAYDKKNKEYLSRLTLQSADGCDISEDSDEFVFSCKWKHVGSYENSLYDDLDKKINNCIGDQIVKISERQPDETTFKRMRLNDYRKTVRLTHRNYSSYNGPATRVRLYVEHDKE